MILSMFFCEKEYLILSFLFYFALNYNGDWTVFQLSVRVNMGFHLLRRKFLRCQSAEDGHGIGSALHW